MNKEERMFCGHLVDLANAAYQRGYAIISDFLTLNEQSLFLSFCVDKLPLAAVTYELVGGYEDAERKAIYFRPIGVGQQYPTPLVCQGVEEKITASDFLVLVRAEPINKKFGKDLNHRDYLGALMNLGIDRSKIGDLILSEEECTIVCLASVADFICENLTMVKHTSVSCHKQEMKQFHYQPKTKMIEGTVASIRLDAVIGLAFSQSRSHLVSCIEGEKVFVNGKCITSNAYQLKEGDLISVRSLGKFRFVSVNQTTRKGRIFVTLALFI